MKPLLLLMLALLLAGCHSGMESRDGYWADLRHPAQGARPQVKVIVIQYTAEDFSSSLATLTD